MTATEGIPGGDTQVLTQPVQNTHARMRQAHLVAAARHRCEAEAHDQAVRTHRAAAAAGIGDVATHRRAVRVYEAARDEHLRAAALAERMAGDP